MSHASAGIVEGFDNQETSLAGVAVIIPALNEAENVDRLVPLLVGMGVGQVIVADNGSTDATGEISARHGATVTHEPQRGYGATCQTALRALRDRIEVVAFLDADFSDDHALLPRVVAPVLDGTHDLVIGARVAHLREPGSMTAPQLFGNWLATRIIRLGWGHRYTDLGPFRAIGRSALESLGMEDRAYGWTVEMQIRAVEAGLRITEIEAPYRKRRGKSKISGTVKGVLLAGYWILATCAKLKARQWRKPKSRIQGRSLERTS